MNAAMKLGIGAAGLGALAATSMVGGMALDKARGERFNTWLTPGTAVAMGGSLPGLALGLKTARMPGPASAAFIGATLLGLGAGALAGRSLIGFAPPAEASGR